MLSSTAEVPNCQALDEWLPRLPLLSGLERCLGTSVLQVAPVWLARCRVVVWLVKAHKRHSRADVDERPWMCASKIDEAMRYAEREGDIEGREGNDERRRHSRCSEQGNRADLLDRQSARWGGKRWDGDRIRQGRQWQAVVGGKHSSGYFVPTFSVSA